MKTTKESTFGATLRTTILLASLSGLLVVAGAVIGGPSTAALFLGIALLINLGSYFFSDKLALKMSRAEPIEESDNPRLFQIVRELTTRAGLPMPRLYMIPQDQPNAFATGRNPKHSAVAVTRGITKLLSEDELRGVLAHELTHIRNRDILIQSVASAIGAAITYLAYMLLWFGGDDESPLGAVAALAMFILAPIAASIIQLAISRQREYAADAGGAEIAGGPSGLVNALRKLEMGSKRLPMDANPATAHMFIIKPFSAGGLRSLFSSHPPTEQRIAALMGRS
jgi:heat shock protein HtpX